MDIRAHSRLLSSAQKCSVNGYLGTLTRRVSCEIEK